MTAPFPSALSDVCADDGKRLVHLDAAGVDGHILTETHEILFGADVFQEAPNGCRHSSSHYFPSLRSCRTRRFFCHFLIVSIISQGGVCWGRGWVQRLRTFYKTLFNPKRKEWQADGKKSPSGVSKYFRAHVVVCVTLMRLALDVRRTSLMKIVLSVFILCVTDS